MDWKYLKSGILNKKLPELTVLTGDNALISIYIDQIYKTFKTRKLTCINDYFNEVSNKIKDEDMVYIIFDDPVLKEKNNLWSYPYKNLVLVYSNIRKDSKFYKAFEPNIIYFNPLNEDYLIAVAKNRIKIKDQDIKWLVQECELNYFKCINEIDKISCFPENEQQNIFNELKRNNLIATKDKLNAFQFSDEVCNRNKIECFKCINKIKKEDVILELSSVYTALKNRLLVQGGHQTAEQLNMSPKLFYYLSKNIKYKVQELCFMLLSLSEFINKIKRGIIDPVDALNLFIMENV